MEFDGLFKKVEDGHLLLTNDYSKRVEDLFKVVDNYVKENYLAVDNYERYYVKYNDNVYCIGYYHGPNILYYVGLERDWYGRYFDFEDIYNNRISEKELYIKEKMDNIKMQIRLLKDEGVQDSLLRRVLK